MQIWSLNYSLHFGSAKIIKHRLIILVVTYIEKLFQQFAAFLAIFVDQ